MDLAVHESNTPATNYEIIKLVRGNDQAINGCDKEKLISNLRI